MPAKAEKTKIEITDSASSATEASINPLAEPVASVTPSVEKTQVISGRKNIEPLNTTQPDNPEEDAPQTTSEPEEHITPDSSQIMTSRAESQMQSPKLFDTKEYHLPITQSVHGHRAKMVAVAFGVIFAIIVVGGTLYILQ